MKFVKTLVTGSAGFIGFHLTRRLLNEGHTVIGLDNINNYYPIGLKFDRLAELGIDQEKIVYGDFLESEKYPNFKYIRLNLEDHAQIMEVFRNEEFAQVVNLAAQVGVRYSIKNPHAYVQSNMVGFANILEACRMMEIEHLVYASSSSVYGLNGKFPFSVHDNVDHPISFYAASKKSNELMAHTYSHLFNIPTTGLRFFTVYGPWGRPDMALYSFTRNIIDGKPIDVYNNGNMERDFTYVDDIVEGIVRVLQNPPKGNPDWTGTNPDPASSCAPYRVFNIGANQSVKLLDFIKEIESATGKKAILNLMPIQPGDVSKTWANVNDLVTELGYRPKTSVKEGIKAFVAWYRNYYKL